MNALTNFSDVQSKANGSDAKVFADLEAIFDCTNKTFFDGALDAVVFSFTRDPRVKSAFLRERYHSVSGEKANGIAINSEFGKSIGDSACMALVGFSIVQSARHQLGPVGKNDKRGTPGYIDSWTRDRLISMGLRPIDENNPERQLGYGLSVAVAEDGPFDLMCREMLISGFTIRWHERPACRDVEDGVKESEIPETKKPQTRQRFECRDCGTKAWAKPSAHLLCGCNGQPLECVTKKG